MSVRFAARHDTQARIYLRTGRPIVFEMGKLNLPFRRICEAKSAGHVVNFSVKKGRCYEIWDAADYAAEQLEVVRRTLGHAAPAPTPARLLDDLLAAVRWAQRRVDGGERLGVARARLSSALVALLDIRIEISAGVDGQVWPQCDLPLSVSFSSADGKAKARLRSITKPDNWKLSRQHGEWFCAAAAPRPERITLRAPANSIFYKIGYPIVAWYDVFYRGVRFVASNASEARVIHAFARTAWVTTVSDTQIDLRIRLESLLPVKGVTSELWLPDGWKGEVTEPRFDVERVKEATYRITRPRGEKADLNIVAAVFHIDDYMCSKRVVVEHVLDLGQSTGVAGLRMIRGRGETAEAAFVGGRRCRRLPASGRLGFDVSENFIPGERTWVTLECAGEGEVHLEYRTADGRRRSSESCLLDSSSEWKPCIFVVRGARFDGGLPGAADVAVICSGEAAISRVCVSRFRAPQRETSVRAGRSGG